MRDMDSDILYTIYIDGKNAVRLRNKKPMGSNPYLEGTASHAAWAKGVKEQKESEGIK
jgi:hypothetical protein